MKEEPRMITSPVRPHAVNEQRCPIVEREFGRVTNGYLNTIETIIRQSGATVERTGDNGLTFRMAEAGLELFYESNCV
jgi:hypothetical protein